MCKSCFGGCLISAIATWGFFALLLTLLNIGNALINAIWLTILVCVAIFCCPVMNQKLAECCMIKPKKEKKK